MLLCIALCAQRCLSIFPWAYFANFRVTWQWNNDSKNCWHLMNNTHFCSLALALLPFCLCSELCAMHSVRVLMVKCGGVSLEILYGKSWRGCHLTSMAPEGVSVSLCVRVCICVVSVPFVFQILFIIQHDTIGIGVCVCVCVYVYVL